MVRKEGEATGAGKARPSREIIREIAVLHQRARESTQMTGADCDKLVVKGVGTSD